ncbi:hypothetical protein ACFV2H_31695 [Streptomyces sp. NPDC059629]
MHTGTARITVMRPQMVRRLSALRMDRAELRGTMERIGGFLPVCLTGL